MFQLRQIIDVQFVKWKSNNKFTQDIIRLQRSSPTKENGISPFTCEIHVAIEFHFIDLIKFIVQH